MKTSRETLKDDLIDLLCIHINTASVYGVDTNYDISNREEWEHTPEGYQKYAKLVAFGPKHCENFHSMFLFTSTFIFDEELPVYLYVWTDLDVTEIGTCFYMYDGIGWHMYSDGKLLIANDSVPLAEGWQHE